MKPVRRIAKAIKYVLVYIAVHIGWRGAPDVEYSAYAAAEFTGGGDGG